MIKNDTEMADYEIFFFFFIFTALIVFKVADDRGKWILMSHLKSLVVVLPLLCLGLGFSSVCGPP